MEIPEPFHFQHERNVEFADTDMAGIMHFSNFFRFVESAEHALFRSLGASIHAKIDGKDYGWPRLKVNSDFFRPAHFEDVLKVCLRVEEVGESTLEYGFWLFSGEVTRRKLIAAGSCTIVFVVFDSKTGKMEKAVMPDELRESFKVLSKG